MADNKAAKPDAKKPEEEKKEENKPQVEELVSAINCSTRMSH